jgi:cobalamin biosynthesis Co2+ chelatase CbiK
MVEESADGNSEWAVIPDETYRAVKEAVEDVKRDRDDVYASRGRLSYEEGIERLRKFGQLPPASKKEESLVFLNAVAVHVLATLFHEVRSDEETQRQTEPDNQTELVTTGN